MRVRDDLNGVETPAGNRRPTRVLIGGIGYRWHGDGSFGLVATDELAREEWASGIEVADLGYGALYVAQDVAHGRYDRVILIAAASRGRQPGGLFRYTWEPVPASPEDIQARIREAGAGVIDLDHLLMIAAHFKAFPPDVTVIEFEPVDANCGEDISTQAKRSLEEVLALVRREAARTALRR